MTNYENNKLSVVLKSNISVSGNTIRSRDWHTGEVLVQYVSR